MSHSNPNWSIFKGSTRQIVIHSVVLWCVYFEAIELMGNLRNHQIKRKFVKSYHLPVNVKHQSIKGTIINKQLEAEAKNFSYSIFTGQLVHQCEKLIFDREKGTSCGLFNCIFLSTWTSLFGLRCFKQILSAKRRFFLNFECLNQSGAAPY